MILIRQNKEQREVFYLRVRVNICIFCLFDDVYQSWLLNIFNWYFFFSFARIELWVSNTDYRLSLKLTFYNDDIVKPVPRILLVARRIKRQSKTARVLNKLQIIYMIILLATAFLKSRFVIQNRDNIQRNYSVIFNFNKVFFFLLV